MGPKGTGTLELPIERGQHNGGNQDAPGWGSKEQGTLAAQHREAGLGTGLGRSGAMIRLWVLSHWIDTLGRSSWSS